MRQIPQKTGIGLNTVYMHYESKEQLLFAFINEWIKRLDNQLVEHLQGLEDVGSVREKIRFYHLLLIITKVHKFKSNYFVIYPDDSD